MYFDFLHFYPFIDITRWHVTRLKLIKIASDNCSVDLSWKITSNNLMYDGDLKF